MFDDIYVMQLRKMSESVLDKLNRKEPLTTEEQLTLILYGLNNHYHTMESGILTELKALRTDMDERFEQVDKRFEQVNRLFEQVDKRFEQVDKRFEQVDKRFEQVDKRFEQVDKRFEQVEQRFTRIYTFLYWMIGTFLAGMGIGFSGLAVLLSKQ